jgi:CDP-glucose 4,6-dehydratase
MRSALPNAGFWRDRRVLVTGSTGFKGAWLSLWLERMGAKVSGLGLDPMTDPSLYALAGLAQRSDTRILDMRDALAVADVVREIEPEIVLHLAGQALVRAGYLDPIGTFATNVMGTANLLNAVRATGRARVCVVITSDKVYRNLEHPYPYREEDRLGGHDPYSASKAAAELVTGSYVDAFLRDRGVAVASARAGNVIGGGDWSADRLIPDAVRAWTRQQPVVIRRPDAIRPWQHVLEPLAGYLRLAERLWQEPDLAGPYNFGPATHDAATVRQVISRARDAFGQGAIVWGDGTEGPHEAARLTLEVAKARILLGVEPRWSLKEAVDRTLRWYREQVAGADAASLCHADIDAFLAAKAGAAVV